MPLSKDTKILAQTLQEAALELSFSDIQKGLCDCLNDMFPGQYCYIADIFGDDEEGDVKYCCAGQYYSAPYQIGMLNGKRTHNIDTDEAKNVLPRTVYDEEADEDDQMTGSMEAYRTMAEAARQAFHVEHERFPGSANWKHRPFQERFISKKTRDSADASDFAGNYDGSPNKKSFPILNAGDVKAAVSSIGRGVAGGHSATSLKNRIKAIAKRKGFAGSLPDAWKGGDDKESKRWKPEGILLIESAAHFLESPRLQEAATADYPIKLISPGRGSSGYYTEGVLKDAANSKVFKAGTQMFWNHDTDAEEGARPEGDLNRLAAVTTTDAAWQESGIDGPGLYARAKVFSDYSDKVKEKGPHIGLSIRAGGERSESATAPDGKPRVITALRNALSVDFVTKAGRDGKVFTESATQINEGVGDMTREEVQALIKESQAPLIAENLQLRQHLALSRGPALIVESLKDIRLHPAAKQRIVETLAPALPFTDKGEVDTKKLNEMIEAAAKNEVRFLESLGVGTDVAGVGTRMTEAELKAQFETDTKAHAQRFEEGLDALADIFVGPKLVKGVVSEAERQMRKNARKAFREGRAA